MAWENIKWGTWENAEGCEENAGGKWENTRKGAYEDKGWLGRIQRGREKLQKRT